MDQEPDDSASALSDLRERLYSREEPVVPMPVPERVSAPLPEAVGWTPPVEPPKKKIAWSVLFLIGAAVLFVVAISVAAFFLIFGTRAISTDRIDIQVAPIAELRSGDVATLILTVTNNNPTTITATKLSVMFPDSARSAEDPALAYARYDDTLGDIPPGESRTRTVRVALSGAQGEAVATPISFEYKTSGSAAVFVKQVLHDVTITSSPLEVRVTTPTTVAVGQEISIEVLLHSTSPSSIENISVLAQYPFGFIPSNKDSGFFDIGTLTPEKDVSFTVRGTITGENYDERVFRFTAGTKGAPGMLARTYAQGQGSVSLAKAFLSTKLSVNNQSGTDLFIPVGKSTDARLTWTNTLTGDLTDAQIAVRLTGEALDPSSIVASGGFYRSVDTTIVYGKESNSALARLNAGAVGNGSFTFATKSADAMKSLRNPSITAVVTVSGKSTGDGNQPQTLSSSFTHLIRISTDFGVTARSTRTQGLFKNTGPIPPQANVESTYTILFGLTSSVNSVAGATVQAVLPSYVRYLGVTSPLDASVAYDPSTRVVTWTAGEVAAGTTAMSPKQGAFQVAFLPSISQQGTSPVLVSSITYSGTDRFTKKQLTGSVYDVTTQTSLDPGFLGTMGQVAR